MSWDHGRNKKKKRDRRRWDGVSTSGRAARIARKERNRKSGKGRMRLGAIRSIHYGAR